MRNINTYIASKYFSPDYLLVSDNVYKYNNHYVTSLSFVQEPSYNEGDSARNISQYPLEDILDKFNVSISDFYHEKNTVTSDVCYLEFCGTTLEDVKNLLTIVHHHVFNKTVVRNGEEYIELIIE